MRRAQSAIHAFLSMFSAFARRVLRVPLLCNSLSPALSRLDTEIALCYPPLVGIEGCRRGTKSPSPLKGLRNRWSRTCRGDQTALTNDFVEQEGQCRKHWLFCCPSSTSGECPPGLPDAHWPTAEPCRGAQPVSAARGPCARSVPMKSNGERLVLVLFRH